MKLHYLQHVPFEDPGYILQWAETKGYQLTSTRFFESDALPAADDIDWLIIMGGPMSVHDEDTCTWMKQEKRFIKDVINRDKPVLGICLGAQLIAQALGAEVFRNHEKEIGWFPIQKLPTNDKNGVLTLMPKRMTVFHWHGETFELPEGAQHLAKSEACLVQAFSYKKTLGLQFHLEMMAEGVKQLVAECSNDITEGAFIQNSEIIMNEIDFLEKNHLIMSSILDHMAKLT